MKISLSILFFLVYYFGQSQSYHECKDTIFNNRELIDLFNMSGYYQSGLSITEELYLLSDSSFLYFNGKDSNIKLIATGKSSQKKNQYFFEYHSIKFDTIDVKGKTQNVNKTQLFTELKLVKNRNYLINRFPDLIKCTKPMSEFRSCLVHGKKYKYTNKIFLPRREYFQLVDSNTYEYLNNNASR